LPALLATAALLLGACTETRGGALASPTIGPSPGPVCAGYAKAQDEAEAKLVLVFPQLAEAMSDPTKAGPALSELNAAMASFDAALSAQATLANDTDLKAAIEGDLSALRHADTAIKAAGADVEKALAALQTDEFKALGEKVRTICEK
jgi:hypothetical protein